MIPDSVVHAIWNIDLTEIDDSIETQKTTLFHGLLNEPRYVGAEVSEKLSADFA